MKLSDIKINTQLQVGFAVILIFVMTLGAIAWNQTNAIAEQTRLLYTHPLQVRQAIGALKTDILSIRINMKDLMSASSDEQMTEIISNMDNYQSDAFDQIKILNTQYLGPHSDVNRVETEFIKYNTIRIETLRLLREGKIKEADARTLPDGEGGKQMVVLLSALEKIDLFAVGKSNELLATSQQLNENLNTQLLFLVVVILVLILIITYILMGSVRRPLNDLTLATQAFKNGNLQARSAYNSKNEFGILAESYNQLAETIQLDIELKEKTASLANLMLSINDAMPFFQASLSALAEYSGSQMAAVYLLSSDQKSYEHFTSIGLNDSGRASFAADVFEGEFGVALASQKIQHIAAIPADTRFSFNTVSGNFTPQEIITIPIISDEKIIAVISLASIHQYNPQTLKLINDVWVTLNARITGILAFKQIQTLAKQLEIKNRELDAQKNELSAQTVELNQQNVELELQKKHLDEVNRLKTSFISNMSHELRTPLNSIIALSGVLNRRLSNQIPQEEHSYLDVIERNGKQLLTLINDILDLSRIEAGREEIDVTQLDINNLLDDIITIINPLAQQKNIKLRYHHNPDLSPVFSDITKIRHILQNLVNNAVKFTETGHVEVSAHKEGDSIFISVSDTGIGIAEDQLPHIFDEFRQADNSTSRRFGGTGLGLAIAKKYALMLGGHISVNSTPGQGSTFTLSLPCHLENKSAARNEDINHSNAAPVNTYYPAPLTEPVKKTILVVEDSEPAIIQLKDILEDHQYHILVARNGSEALEFIQYTLPDAMILDLMMPGVDGFEVLKTVRENEKTARLPILILTAKHVTKDELKFLKHNHIYQLIQKGDINRIELLKAVSGMLQPQTKEVKKTKPVPQNMDGKPLVLVVEDNPDNRLTVKALLADDFDIIEAADGKSGIEQARRHTPHLILMDIALPDMDGIRAFNILRNETLYQNIPVIALTASAMTSERETILAYGFDGYITKPIDRIEFLNTIQQVLYGKE